MALNTINKHICSYIQNWCIQWLTVLPRCVVVKQTQSFIFKLVEYLVIGCKLRSVKQTHNFNFKIVEHQDFTGCQLRTWLQYFYKLSRETKYPRSKIMRVQLYIQFLGLMNQMFGKMNIKYTNPILHIFNTRCLINVQSMLI